METGAKADALAADRAALGEVLDAAVAEARAFLEGLDERPAAVRAPSFDSMRLGEEGVGAREALERFRERFGAWMSGSAGPRYFGFVTGGATPAALAGDWLASAYDQNNTGAADSASPAVELEALAMLRGLFGLSDAHGGSFVSGATMSSFVGLAVARQWVGREMGIDVAEQGVHALGPVKVLSGTAHSSVFKALSMLGMGRAALESVPLLADREAVDVGALEEALRRQEGRPCIVVANAGTVNTVDFDDLRAIAALRERHRFWLHVDAAFGAFAACSPRFRHLTDGLDLADSITVDGHKWLNVPYDSAVQFTRHPELQAEVFRNAAAYLRADFSPSNFLNLTPENSRRFRALPAWMTLVAYGRGGYAEIVERNARLAAWIGERVDAAERFRLLAPVRLNGVCFAPLRADGTPASREEIARFLDALRDEGTVFLTPTVYFGTPAVRVSLSNWRTHDDDARRAWDAIRRVWEGGEW